MAESKEQELGGLDVTTPTTVGRLLNYVPRVTVRSPFWCLCLDTSIAVSAIMFVTTFVLDCCGRENAAITAPEGLPSLLALLGNEHGFGGD